MYNTLDLLVPASHTAIKLQIWAGAITAGFLFPMAELVWKPFKQNINTSVTNQQASTCLLYLKSITDRAQHVFPCLRMGLLCKCHISSI